MLSLLLFAIGYLLAVRARRREYPLAAGSRAECQFERVVMPVILSVLNVQQQWVLG